jgi:uncharacterized RDD family membrane protein YckC
VEGVRGTRISWSEASESKSGRPGPERESGREANCMSDEHHEGVVTPEAVVLDFARAGIGSRGAAAIVDITLQGLGIFASLLTVGALTDGGGPAWVGVTLGIFAVFVFTIVYTVMFETLWRGRTPGKAAMGLRVVTVEGGPIAFRHAAIRGALGVIEVIGSAGAIAMLTVFFSRRSQRLGDMVAGTLVLRQRSASGEVAATSFTPWPGSEEYVATLDVSHMSHDEYQTIRSFLLRAPSIKGESRNSLGVQLANRMAARLHTQPPSWMNAEVFLIGVASAYQQRFSR